MASVVLPILAGPVFALPFVSLISRRRPGAPRSPVWEWILVVAMTAAGVATALVHLRSPGQGVDGLDLANMASTCLCGVVLFMTARHIRRSNPEWTRTMNGVLVLAGAAGLFITSYVLLPVGLLFLAVAYAAFPFAYVSQRTA